MKKNEIIDAFWSRHACKEFDVDRKISDEDFRYILETARLSPSSFGFEPWHFIVVQDPELREKLKERAWGASLKLDTASHFVVCLAMKPLLTRHNSQYIKDFMRKVQQLPEEIVKMKGEFFKDFQEKDFDLNTDRSLYDWAGKQTYLALGNMMTAAALIGIDSCPIEGFHPATTEAILSRELRVDLEKYGVSYMVAFGYRKNNPATKTRRPIEDIVTWK